MLGVDAVETLNKKVSQDSLVATLQCCEFIKMINYSSPKKTNNTLTGQDGFEFGPSLKFDENPEIIGCFVVMEISAQRLNFRNFVHSHSKHCHFAIVN